MGHNETPHGRHRDGGQGVRLVVVSICGLRNRNHTAGVGPPQDEAQVVC